CKVNKNWWDFLGSRPQKSLKQIFAVVVFRRRRKNVRRRIACRLTTPVRERNVLKIDGKKQIFPKIEQHRNEKKFAKCKLKKCKDTEFFDSWLSKC
uniref:Uncharacterized protein n=1 Tax=Romanomermis culicivorax TaxID=13658 RepID=A0A915JAW9_ROMCU